MNLDEPPPLDLLEPDFTERRYGPRSLPASDLPVELQDRVVENQCIGLIAQLVVERFGIPLEQHYLVRNAVGFFWAGRLAAKFRVACGGNGEAQFPPDSLHGPVTPAQRQRKGLSSEYRAALLGSLELEGKVDLILNAMDYDGLEDLLDEEGHYLEEELKEMDIKVAIYNLVSRTIRAVRTAS